MAEQAMDARSSAAFLRQRWRSIVAMGVVGVALGALYGAMVPAALSSSTLLLFPDASGVPVPGQDPVTVTQVHIVASTPVLDRAGRSLSPVLSAAQVEQRVTVDAKTSNLIEIRASSPNARQAQRLSQAVAQAYIATLEGSVKVLNAVPPALTSRDAALTTQLNKVRAQITATTNRQRNENANSAAGLRDAQLQAALVNDQTDLLVRLDKVREAEHQAADGAVQIPDIIQPASPATGPSAARRMVTWALTGGLLVAGATAVTLLIRRRRDPRVRARDDLADAVGSGLLAVVRGHPQRSVAGWLTLFDTYDAPAEEAWAFRQVLRALVSPSDSRTPGRSGARQAGLAEHPRSLNVIALADDQRAAAVAAQLAVFAASLGITTRFVVGAKHDSIAPLWAACTSDRASQLRSGLVLQAGATESDATDRDASFELTIVLSVAERREPKVPGIAATAITILAISPGVGTREELARLAVAVDDAGHRFDGVVVADRDPADRTSGRHTLDMRAVQPPLPIRLTGASQMPPAPGGRSSAR